MYEKEAVCREDTIVENLIDILGPNGPGGLGSLLGDDCACLPGLNGGVWLLTCDAHIEGVHFRCPSLTLREVGWRAAVSALSDIAAAGGRPLWALLSLHLSHGNPEMAAVELVSGASEALKTFKAVVAGGNVSRSEYMSIDVFLVGYRAFPADISRSTGRAGDLIAVTGRPGEAAAGRALVYGTRAGNGAELCQESLAAVQRFKKPVPRIGPGQFLAASGLVRTMIDVSDGLIKDLGRLCQASGLGSSIEEDCLPMSDSIVSISTDRNEALQWLLHGGEDYELLFTVSPDQADELVSELRAKFGIPVTVFGEMTAGKQAVRIRNGEGLLRDITPQGFEHFSDYVATDSFHAGSRPSVPGKKAG